jgi:hypothetical protein
VEVGNLQISGMCYDLENKVAEKPAESGNKWQKVAVFGNLLKHTQSLTHSATQPKHRLQDCHFY